MREDIRIGIKEPDTFNSDKNVSGPYLLAKTCAPLRARVLLV
jgi:hypothetical protein